MEVPDTKVQQPIHQMEPDQLRLWSQYYLFQESLGEIADIRGIRRDSSDEDSDSRMTATSSRRMPMGSQSNLAASVSGASGTVDRDESAPGLAEASTAREERPK